MVSRRVHNPEVGGSIPSPATTDFEFPIGSIVVLKTDRERIERMVTRITVTEGLEEYGVRYAANDTTWHYAFELEYAELKRKPGFT